MPGLGGFPRDPRSDARTRRGQQRLSGTTLFLGDGVQLDDDGKFTLALNDNGGLQNDNTGLSIKIATNEPFSTSASGFALTIGANTPLSKTGGNLTFVIGTNEPFNSPLGNFTLKIGTNEPISKSGGNLALAIGTNEPISKSGGNLSLTIGTNEPLAKTGGNLALRIGTNEPLSKSGGNLALTIGANEPISKTGGNLALQNGTTLKKPGGTLDVAPQGTNGSIQFNNNGSLGGANASINITEEGYLNLPGGLRIMGIVSSAAAPTTVELPSNGSIAIHRNTGNGTIALAFNDNGTIRATVLS